MAIKEDWLNAGLAILAERGAPALTIERVSEALGLSKGSFYHHFGGLAGYRTALLAHYEARTTTRIIDQVEADSRATAEEKLSLLSATVLSHGGDPALEIAMRAWAQQDLQVAAMQQRVDRTRVDYLRGLMTDLGRNPDLGDLMYLVLIGGNHVLPALSADRLQTMWALALR